MIDWLLTMRIDTPTFLVPLYAVTAALFLYLIVRTPPRTMVFGLGFAALGAATGLLTSWLVSDVWDLFGVPLTSIVRMLVALCFAGLFLAVFNLWARRWWRKVVAIVSIFAFVVGATAGINVDFGAYGNLNDALALTPYPTLSAAELSGHAGTMEANLSATWRAPAGMPSHGTVGMVNIPATQSHFPAREAAIYLPPAALVANPPVLPVVIMFAGQPGNPADIFHSGRVSKILDAYAAKHDGLAPIVVAPDQLGDPLKNPMCVDSPLGNAATYLTVDVPNWMRKHLNIATSPRYWAVGGYSQGGTCSIQFGAGHPELFGSVIDIIGQVEPTIGDATVATAFGSSEQAYDAVKPLTLLTRNAPFADSVLFVGEGSNDKKYSAYGRQIEAAAAKAGMTTQLIVSADTGHDWNTVQFVLTRALPTLCTRWGLGS